MPEVSGRAAVLVRKAKRHLQRNHPPIRYIVSELDMYRSHDPEQPVRERVEQAHRIFGDVPARVQMWRHEPTREIRIEVTREPTDA